MKKVIAIITILVFIFNTGCTKKLESKYALTDEESVNTNDTTNNMFFFEKNVLHEDYKGKFLFFDDIEKNVELKINEVATLQDGSLYELIIDDIDDVPEERLNLGYFYIMDDKIFRMEATEENLSRLKTDEDLPSDSVIVCQDKELIDSLSEEEKGWHQFITVDGDKREYHSYNNLVETGYYETFIWEKGKGLVYYRSGFGAERDYIELQLIN